jgi:oligoendopeptidase F
MQRETPMTLAETASIFCETIVKNAVLEHGTDAERLTALEAALGGACQVVVDISSRFLFEQNVYDLRSRRELAPRELSEFMLQAQRDTYGDGLDESQLHPYMWAAKPHYYGSSFYNFPYMFGLLFGLGLYAEYQRQPDGFHARYDALLSRTGLADAATLASEFGIDIRTPDFWRASLAQIEADVEAFEKLV